MLLGEKCDFLFLINTKFIKPIGNKNQVFFFGISSSGILDLPPFRKRIYWGSRLIRIELGRTTRAAKLSHQVFNTVAFSELKLETSG